MTEHPAILKARDAWGDDLPDWVMGLAQACAASSQNKVAQRMGYSASLISQVLGRKYPGDLSSVRDRYLGIFEAKTVDCPELGNVPLDRCQDWRKKARHLQPGNARNVQMFRACNRCPVFKEAQAKADQREEAPDA